MLRRTLLAGALLLASFLPAAAEKCTTIGGNGVQTECVTNMMPIGSSAVATAQVGVAASSTLVAAARLGRNAVTVQNLGTTAVYLGPSGVTTATGLLLPGSVGASVTIPTSAAVYGVAATGTQSVAVLETF